jgi:hypothetical protein
LFHRHDWPDAWQKRKKTRAPIIEQLSRTASAVVGSGQAALQHTGTIDCGCFLSDLTGFTDIPLSRTQPSTPRAPNLTKGQSALRWEFNLAKADCELQDTANFPSSAGKTKNSVPPDSREAIASPLKATKRLLRQDHISDILNASF